jgi:hypothetical protein
MINDHIECRNAIASCKLFPKIIQIIEKSEEEVLSMLRTESWFISAVNKYTDFPLSKEQINDSLRACNRFLCYQDFEIIHNSLWTLSYLVNISEDHMPGLQEIICQPEGGFLEKIFKIDYISKFVACRFPLIRILDTLSTGHPLITQKLLDHGVLDVLNGIIGQTYKKDMKRIILEITWIVSNIIASNALQCETVIMHPIFLVLHANLSATDAKILKESSYIISTCTSYTNFSISQQLESKSTIQKLLSLVHGCVDVKTVENCIKSIIGIVESGEYMNGENVFLQTFDHFQGKGIFEEIKNLHNQKIFQFAQGFLNKFYYHQGQLEN